jgi:glycosyltransferase involved in cell wall biosynthesis
MSDLYIFPSRHESYGLTLMEALAAGLPAVCLEHQGSREIMTPALGRMLAAGEPLWQAVEASLADDDGRRKMSEAARRYASERPFALSAARLAALLAG